MTYGIYMHAKTTIIDDNWAMIGSNNVWRRYLYTDWEHAISFIDGDGKAIKAYRDRLWQEHFRVGTSESRLPANYFPTSQAKDAIAAWFDPAKYPQRHTYDPGPDFLRLVTLPISIPLPHPDQSTIYKIKRAPTKPTIPIPDSHGRGFLAKDDGNSVEIIDYE